MSTTKTTTRKPATAEAAVRAVAEAPAHTLERDNRGMQIGEVGHQGDVYVCRVEKHADIYALNKLLGEPRDLGKKTRERQVTPGVTLGSRHVVVGKHVTIYAPPPSASPLEGPTVEAEGEWSLDHPEHARHLFGAGCFVVTFQRDWAEEVRRVAD